MSWCLVGSEMCIRDRNNALAVLNSTSSAAELFSFQFDGTNGYLFDDVDSDGVADQVIILVGITDGSIAATDIIL
jgi:hypothetical protein